MGYTASRTALSSIGSGPNNSVYALAVQPDEKILLGGDFTSFGWAVVGRLIRINSDGTPDSSFVSNMGVGGNSGVSAIAIQPDGKILVGGSFFTWNGTTVGRIVRLNSDGTVDTDFSTQVGTGAPAQVLAITLQPDGKILVGGFFTSWDGVTVGKLVRLNSDGSRDTDFSTQVSAGASNDVRGIALQSDGKILVGGTLNTWNNVSVGRIVRLNSDGSRDTAFSTQISTGGNSIPLDVAVQSDGKILVAGLFNTWNGTNVGRIVRLNSDGTLDTAFTTANGTGADTNIIKVVVQSDGKILVCGQFILWNGTTVGRIVRLNSDGTLDADFTTANGTGAGSTTRAVTVQSDGKILVGGDFNSWNGDTNIAEFTRLSSSGSSSGEFSVSPPDVVFAVVVGEGGSGGPSNGQANGGGGAGAVAWGLVPTATNISINSGSIPVTKRTTYSLLTAYGGGSGGNITSATAGEFGSAGGGGAVAYSSSGSNNNGAAGSSLYMSVGGAGGQTSSPSSGNALAVNGTPGTSGGGGGGANISFVGATTETATAGSGGDGLVGGGGGAATCDIVGHTGAIIGGAGGRGLYSGGTATSVNTSDVKSSGGGGGGGLLGPGGNGAAVSGTATAAAGNGGFGGGGGGGRGGNLGTGGSGGAGGVGCVLIYW
jgi:uncharacterized delta-60 repeat protein